MHTSEKSRVEDRFGMLPMGAPTYRRHGHTTVSREKSEGALQQAAVTETGA